MEIQRRWGKCAEMDIDPKELLEEKERREELELEADRDKLKLNALVAITIAVLATFMGLCKIKDENIVLEMGKVQSTKLDTWNFYQARNIRQDVYQTSADQFRLQGLAVSPSQSAFNAQAQIYAKLAADQKNKKDPLMKQAQAMEKDYEKLHGRHDQFDLEDAALAIGISLFAITSLTQKRWMYAVALVPTACGVLMGAAGLANVDLKVESLMKFLG